MFLQRDFGTGQHTCRVAHGANVLQFCKPALTAIEPAACRLAFGRSQSAYGLQAVKLANALM